MNQSPTHLTIQKLDFNLPHMMGSLLNHFSTDQGHTLQICTRTTSSNNSCLQMQTEDRIVHVSFHSIQFNSVLAFITRT